MNAQLQRTACHAWHVANGGRMVDFAGWDMPVQYTSIIEEHHAVRRAAGLFDIGHMGRIQFIGPDAGQFLSHLTTIDVNSMALGQVRYALITNEQGGILDDVLVYRFENYHMLVVNASNRKKILGWIGQQTSLFDSQVKDQTFDLTMLALQGPRAIEILQPFVETDIAAMSYYHAAETSVLGVWGIVSRTGYTGEDGFEVITSAPTGPKLWETLMQRGQDAGIAAAGLGCRDTLRLEAGMPLYGHELNESIDPFIAGLGFAVQLEGDKFVGRIALREMRENPGRDVRVGLMLEGKRIAREGAAVFQGDDAVGIVTSGTFSPTHEQSIAMAYVHPAVSQLDTPLEVDIRGKRSPARVVKLPFYRRRKPK